MADPIQSFLALHEQSEAAPHACIPGRRRTACCCGNDACAYLKHNQTALEDLERDVDTAARLGKALLVRHEAYITDSERERKEMSAHIESLEADKQSLEKANASVIEENRVLLDQLEALNNAVAQSDEHVTGLQATLASTQREMHKLTQLAARTESLERQLADFEREQAMWQSSLEGKEQSERSAVRRWQTAERTLAQLQEQMEQIEKEAKAEKERHAEILGRMERRHAVEKELGSAAGRLKGAAALKNGEGDASGNGNGVVSHFVKDILQDNANLQMGIVELREMLNNSNEEVEVLRNQLSLHQPSEESEETPQPIVERRSLSMEMNRTNSQELHVHHHYHAPPSAAPKPQTLRRPKKKRYGAFVSGQSTPPSGTSTPRSSFSYGTPTSTAAILQQTAASVPAPSSSKKRWSTQSNQTFYSMLESSPGPSSPQSVTNRTSSVFDRVFSDAGQDSSRPTTPDTEEPGSPILAPTLSKRSMVGGGWGRTASAPVVQRHGIICGAKRPSLDAIMSIEELPKLEQAGPDEETAGIAHPILEEEEGEGEAIPHASENAKGEEWEDNDESLSATDAHSSLTSPLSEDLQPLHHYSQQQPDIYRPPLRRATSHESLLSVSGMDIHTLQSRPSQLLAPYAGRALTSQAVISDTTAHAARPVAMSRTSTTGRSLLSGMASEQRQQQQPPAAKPTLGKKVGGWVFGRWGATPAPSSADDGVTKTATSSLASTNKAAPAKPKPKPAPSVASASSSGDKIAAPAAGDKPQSPLKPPKVRSPGINQDGPLQGFFPEIKALPSTPVLKNLDEEALRKVLDGA